MVAPLLCGYMTDTAIIRVIIGLGNPGRAHQYQRHNIGFRVLDALADTYHRTWKLKDNAEIADIVIHGHPVLLIKPQTYMNSSGAVVPALLKKGITAAHILVVHDELEKPFGHVSIKFSGSAKGHNGLRSLMQYCGADFFRLRCGIGRPERKDDVGTYVLSNFNEGTHRVDQLISDAQTAIEQLFLQC